MVADAVTLIGLTAVAHAVGLAFALGRRSKTGPAAEVPDALNASTPRAR